MAWKRILLITAFSGYMIALVTACDQSNTKSPMANRGAPPGSTGATGLTPTSTGGGTGGTGNNSPGGSASAQGNSGTLQATIAKSNTSVSLTGSYRSSKGANVAINLSQNPISTQDLSSEPWSQVGSNVSYLVINGRCIRVNNPCDVALFAIWQIDYDSTNSGIAPVVSNFSVISDAAGTRIKSWDGSLFSQGYIEINELFNTWQEGAVGF